MVPPEPPASAAPKLFGGAAIVGLLAAIVPFVVGAAKYSIDIRDGKVTHFEYQDFAAIIGGVVAAVCGVIVALSLRNPAGRPKRAILVVLLVGLGVFQLLRGFGVTQDPQAYAERIAREHGIPSPADDPMVREAQKHLATPPSGSGDGPNGGSAKDPKAAVADLAQYVWNAWAEGRFKPLMSQFDGGLREKIDPERMAKMNERIVQVLGACRAPAPPYAMKQVDRSWTVSTEMMCAQGKLAASLTIVPVSTTWLVDGFNFGKPDGVTADPKEAEVVARRALDALLAPDADAFLADADLRVRENIGNVADFKASLAKIRDENGAPVQIKLGKVEVSDGDVELLAFAVASKTGKLEAKIEVTFVLRRWLVTEFHLGPAGAK